MNGKSGLQCFSCLGNVPLDLLSPFLLLKIDNGFYLLNVSRVLGAGPSALSVVTHSHCLESPWRRCFLGHHRSSIQSTEKRGSLLKIPQVGGRTGTELVRMILKEVPWRLCRFMIFCLSSWSVSKLPLKVVMLSASLSLSLSLLICKIGGETALNPQGGC